MNTLAANLTVLTLGVGALAKGLDFLYDKDYTTGGIVIAVGIIFLVIYEKLPLSTPPTE